VSLRMRVCACPGRGSKIPTSFIHFRSKSKNANIFMRASDGSDERIVADSMAAVTITSAVTMLLLPEDVMRKILSFVEGRDLALVEQTCQLLRAAADESLWRALVVKKRGWLIPTQVPHLSWHECALESVPLPQWGWVSGWKALYVHIAWSTIVLCNECGYVEPSVNEPERAVCSLGHRRGGGAPCTPLSVERRRQIKAFLPSVDATPPLA